MLETQPRLSPTKAQTDTKPDVVLSDDLKPAPTAKWTRSEKLQATAIAVAIFGAMPAIGLLTFQLYQLNSNQRRDRVVEWQKVVVYQILQKSMVKDRTPLSIKDILRQYKQEARTVSGIALRDEDLEELALRKALLDLMAAQLVMETPGGKYLIQQSSPDMKFDRYWLQSDAADALFLEIDKHTGKKTVADLEASHRSKLNLTPEEFNRVILTLRAAAWIGIDHDGMIHSAFKPPKPPEPAKP